MTFKRVVDWFAKRFEAAGKLPRGGSRSDKDPANEPATRVFLSSVTREYGWRRQDLKTKLAAQGVALSIQEDFADSVSPHGTLLKIYLFLSKADMVVHVIGAQQPCAVAREEFEELFRVMPLFRDWLAEKAILAAVESGAVGYTHFEAYMAQYLDTPLVIVSLADGVQSEHERRLQSLGRHVNGRIQHADDLVGETLRALKAEKELDRRGHLTRAGRARRRRDFGLMVFIATSILAALAVHLSIVIDLDVPGPIPLREWLNPLASFTVLAVALVGLHMASMTDALTLSFRLRLALRNCSIWLLLTVSSGWALAEHEGSYLYVSVGALLLLGFAVRSDTKGLEKEMEDWRLNPPKLSDSMIVSSTSES